MSKYIKIVFSLFIFSFGLLFYFPQTTLAANCEFKVYNPNDLTTPITPDQNADKLKIKITSSDITQGTYRLVTIAKDFPITSNGIIKDIIFTPGVPNWGVTLSKPVVYNSGDYWKPQTYFLYLIDNNQTGKPEDIYNCKGSFDVVASSAQQSCTISVKNTSINPATPVELHIAGLGKSTVGWPDTGQGGYDIIINDKKDQVYSKKTDNDEDISLNGFKGEKNKGMFDVGTYTVKIFNRCGWGGMGCDQPAREQCNCVGFKVNPIGNGGGGEISCTDVSQGINCKNLSDNPGPGDLICTTSQAKAVGCTNNAISTAIGCVRTDPAGFTQDLLKFGVGIGGGLAFLMMLLGAFQMLTSAGNPETLNAGKDRLTSAVIGLLFIIFAVLLLKIIGVDILGLGGQFGY